MRFPVQLGYHALAQLARGAAAVAPNSESKLLRSLRARRGIRARYRAWGATGGGRDVTRPLLWMHAPSVGEGLQARPVLDLMRTRRPDVQLAYTHFSPSASAFARGLDVDFHDYLPFDTPGDCRAALDALAPTALVFSKLDVWPVITREARARGVRLGMVSATLARGSSRRSRAASAVLRDAYAALEVVGAIDDADADRLVQLGVRPPAISVTGDTRYDQVWLRAQRTERESPLLQRLRDTRATIVAGSTWPSDEAALLPSVLALRSGGGKLDTRLIIAPHEPTADHVTRIIEWAKQGGLSVARLDEAGPWADVVVIDRVGVLGDIYALADIAYVGGGFHSAGLHSVLEPAAFGAPVVFGPRYEASRDAALLVQRGGGASASTESDLTRRLRFWVTDTASRREAGDYARALVRSGVGAADRSYELVERLLR
ncbi:MAG TPA: glycosyltransferase N-terminal domain-containing protein [Gemmatimonadaceae bacterium]|nr:glycosyltransferase N-terminal domain-containing protein [Gemmatimonadaceae bacterium]